MNKFVNYIVILCGLAGFYFSCVGWQKFPDKRLLFVITCSGSALAVLLGIRDIVSFNKKIDSEITKIILSILSGLVLICGGLYILFFLNPSLIMKWMVIFSIIFFSIAVTKGISKLFKSSE